MASTRMSGVLALACVVGIAGCKREGRKPAGAADGAVAEAMEAGPPSWDALRPVLSEQAEEGVTQSALVVELAQPVADVGQTPTKGTILELEPAVEGALAWTTPSTLVFTPSAALRPDTEYRAKLLAVETKLGLVKASPAVERVFRTPPFSFLRAEFGAFDPKKSRLEVELVFSGAVAVSSVKEAAAWTLQGSGIGRVTYEATERKHVVRATLFDKRIDFGKTVHLELSGRAQHAVEHAVRAQAGSADVKVNEGEPITIFASYVHEGANGFYIAVVCKDAGAGKEEQYYYDDVVSQSFQVSKRCVLDESDVLDSVHFKPAVKVTVSPMRGGFRLMGNFARGSYAMRIEQNARSMDGGVLKRPYTASFSVPARKPQLTFVSQGRYLPRSAWQNLPIRHMNLSSVELVVRHVPPENLVFWMGGDQETADDRTSNIVLKKTLPLQGKADALTTTWVDVGTMLPAIPRGIVELAVTGEGAHAKARLLVTDINLVAKAEHEAGKIWVWAVDMHDNRPLEGVTVKQVLRSGRTISTCETDRLGGCELAGLTQKDKELDPSQPFALVASNDGDLTYLKFDDLRTEIADALVQGRPFQSDESPYRAAIYGDRGVYRPGETAHVAAILRGRDDLAPPEGMPVEVKLVDPKKKVARKLVRKTNPAGHLSVDLKFDDFADTGSWQVALEAGKKTIGEYTFNVEEFVPERMKVTARAETPELLFSDSEAIAVEARYLFGGSASGSRTELACELKPTLFAPKTNAGYVYGVWYPEEKPPRPLAVGNASGAIGDDGKTKLSCPPLTQRGSFVGTARLAAKVAVFEAGSGRTTQADASALVHPERFYLGLQSGTRKVKANEAFKVDGVVVDWTGTFAKEAAEVELELFEVQNENDWIYEEGEGRWSYRHYTHLASLGKLPKVTAQNGKFGFTATAPSDAAAYVVRARSGKAQTDLRLEGSQPYWWWWSTENGRDETPRPMRPATVELTTPDLAKIGDKTKVSFVSPFKGRALLSVETDRVLVHEWVDVRAGPGEWSFKIPEPEAKKGEPFPPNVYFSAFVVKDPHQDSKESFLPSRAFGVRSIRVEPEAFRHVVKLEVPAEIRSGAKLEVKLDLGKLDEPTFATVAAVDEGILSLTRFETPDPLQQIFDRRGLGVETFETIGWNLLLPAAGPTRSSGGDTGAGAGRVQPIKPVALWSGVVEVPASGKASVTFDVPQYRGQLRVMVVTAGKKRMGSASADVLVRDPLVLETTLPRFLTQNDLAEVPVFVSNLSGSPQDVDVTLTAEALPVPGLVSAKTPEASELIKIEGEVTKKLRLGKEGTGKVVFSVRALQAVGAAKLKVHLQAGAITSSEELDVPFSPAAPKTREVQRIELGEGTTDLRPYLKGWLPTTERTTVWVTANPYGEAFDHLAYLLRYPYGCIEQTTSSTRPLLYVADLVQNVDPTLVAKERIESLVMSGVNRILSMQTPSGGFAYWPGESEPTPWGTAYATHLLLDAQKLKYPVPEERVKDAVEWLEREVTTRFESGKVERRDWYHWENAEPYMQFVLAAAGHGRKARLEKLLAEARAKVASSKVSGSEKAEHVYMLEAALYMAGDHRYEAELKSPDVTPIASKRENSWSFYSDRRRRGFMLSTFTDLFGNDPAGEKLAQLVAEGLRGHASGWYTTQELVWGVTGLGKRVGSTVKSYSPAVLVANGKTLKAEDPGAGSKSSDRSWAVARASEHKELSVRVDKIEGGKIFVILSSEGVKENATYKLGGEGLKLKRELRLGDGEPVSAASGLELGAVVYSVLTLTNATGERVENLALVDRFPAGFEIENPRLGRESGELSWLDRNALWTPAYMNLRDDRIELFGVLEPGQTRTIAYALRAVAAGQYAMPPAEAEAMYNPEVWAREGGAKVTIRGPAEP